MFYGKSKVQKWGISDRNIVPHHRLTGKTEQCNKNARMPQFFISSDPSAYSGEVD